MLRALKEWLILSCIVLFIILDGVIMGVAAFAFLGGLLIGIKKGFDIVITVTCLLFVFLLAGYFVNVLMMRNPERILKAVWPNVLSAITSLVWLLLAFFIIYGLLGSGLELAYYHVFLSVAIIIIIVNLPSLVFRSALCVPRFRKLMQEAYENVRRRIERVEATPSE